MKPVAWSLKMDKSAHRVNAMTTFDTKSRAEDYADKCAIPDVCIPNPVRPTVVALYHEADVAPLVEALRRIREILADEGIRPGMKIYSAWGMSDHALTTIDAKERGV